MKKFFSMLLMGVLVFNVANAQTKVEIGIAGDTYYATDNDQSVELGPRQLASTNIFKDRIGTNNVLLTAGASSADWRANFALSNFGEKAINLEEANVGLRLIEGLWVTGGIYPNWDGDYSYNNWFTGNSLTDLQFMAAPYVAWGLEYTFTDDITFGAGLMNSGFTGGINEDINRSKSIYAKLDWNNLFNDWGLVLSFVTGNESPWEDTHRNLSEIYLLLGGTIVDKLEGLVYGKYFMYSVDRDDTDALTMMTFQASARYHFTEKFNAGLRFSFMTTDISTFNWKNDGSFSGIDLTLGCEYRPVPYAYIRLEGGMVSLSASDSKFDNYAKIFWNGTEDVSSRLGVALSMGFKLGLFEREIK